MEAFLLDRQEDLFAWAFYGSIVLFALTEFLLPRTRPGHGVVARWSTNIGLGLINVFAARVILPLGTIALAIYAGERNWGLFNLVDITPWVTLPLGILVLDHFKYWEHVLEHKVPLLWRLHVVHHADLDIDFTTGFRHHPFESLFAALVLPIVIVAFGVSPAAVIIFQVLAAIAAVFTHANIRYRPGLDRFLRLMFMTRDAHAVHHSAKREETDSNFGLIFLFWDRLFGTYRPEPLGGLDGMTTGVEYFREDRELVLDKVLTQPFRVPGMAFTAPPEDRQPAP